MLTRRAKRVAEEEVLRKEIAGLRESIRGYQAQAKSTKQRLALFAEELKDKTSLLERAARAQDRGAGPAALRGRPLRRAGRAAGRIADSNERIARAEQQIAQMRSAATQKAVEELRATETELDDVQEQIRAAQDVVERTEVRAPVRGIVVKLNQHTHGGVVAPGAVILELLPVNDELIIEARAQPQRHLARQQGRTPWCGSPRSTSA